MSCDDRGNGFFAPDQSLPVISVSVVAYWVTYVIATVVIDIGESKNIFELLIILLLVMFSALVFR